MTIRGSRSRDRSVRPGGLAGHHASDALCAAVVAAVVIGLWPLPGIFLFLAPIGLLAAVVVAWLAMRAHDRRLCERCMRAMPLDASRRAAHYGGRFACVHLSGKPLLVLGYFAVLIGSNAVPGLVGHVFWAAAQLSLIYLIRAHVTHRRFQPWCERCHPRGDAERIDAPEPLPDDHRQLV